ncbi:hypothetical protein TIFTF001_035425 [Ficus carica]|uniref:Uncharacterized protein n=1 Tax=Ficus carica TaxID=3494 RepID=A0AA88E4S4_FICCA|nr:hypothetical protein TIFTF001_035425 [Ficus carica]
MHPRRLCNSRQALSASSVFKAVEATTPPADLANRWGCNPTHQPPSVMIESGCEGIVTSPPRSSTISGPVVNHGNRR